MADRDDRTLLAFADPRFELRFRYPARTPGGAPVELSHSAPEEPARVHLKAAGGREVYFEVTRYSNVLATQHYAEMAQYTRRRRDELAVSDLEPTRCAGRPARRFRLYRGRLEREVILIECGESLYRLLYDPRSPLNADILASVTFA
jgi:hypothetical protein